MLSTLLALSLTSTVEAGPLENFTLHDDGSVVMNVLVEKPVAAVSNNLSSAMSVLSLDFGRTITKTVSKGACQELHVETPGLFSPMQYVSLRCPTTDGYTESMVSSEDFDASEVQWTLTEVDGGTRITYRVLIDLAFPVSQDMIQSRVKKSMRSVMSYFLDDITEE